MTDKTEMPRRIMIAQITSEIESNDKNRERARLEVKYGIDNVWDTDDVTREFEISGFMAPFCAVTRRSDLAKGLVQFQHSPRFYFDFQKG